MAHRIILMLVLLALALRVEGLMVRVVAIVDGKTIEVEKDGTRERLALAGIAITDEVQARALLRWTLEKAWVMAEARGEGFFVYRSPDALFINRELVLRGFARATRADVDPPPVAMVTYLGTVAPMNPLPQEAPQSTRKRGGRTASAAASASKTRARTSSGTRRRPAGSGSRSSPTSSRDRSGASPAPPSE